MAIRKNIETILLKNVEIILFNIWKKIKLFGILKGINE